MMLVIYILIAVFVLLFVFTVVVTVVSRRRARRHIIDRALKEYSVLNVAVAGSEDGCHKAEQTTRVWGLDMIQYKDSQGRILELSDYNLFIVDGESMRFCGIYNNDVIFSTKTFTVEDACSFPVVLVIRKNHVVEGYPAYKIRRAWCVVNYDSGLIEVVKNLLESDSFQLIRKLPEYPGDEFIIDDFVTLRLPRYEEVFINCPNADVKDRSVIISTTYNTQDKVVHLSIHPVNRVVGKVIASFHLPDKYLSH